MYVCMYIYVCTHIYISTNKNVKLSKTSSMVRKYIAILMWLWCCRIIQGTCGILVNLYFGILSNPQTLSSFLSPLSLEVKCKALFRGQRRIRTRWSMTHILFVWHIWRFMFQSIPFATTFATTLHWGFHLEILELANQPIHLGPWRTRFCGTSCTGNAAGRCRWREWWIELFKVRSSARIGRLAGRLIIILINILGMTVQRSRQISQDIHVVGWSNAIFYKSSWKCTHNKLSISDWIGTIPFHQVE